MLVAMDTKYLKLTMELIWLVLFIKEQMMERNGIATRKHLSRFTGNIKTYMIMEIAGSIFKFILASLNVCALAFTLILVSKWAYTHGE